MSKLQWTCYALLDAATLLLGWLMLFRTRAVNYRTDWFAYRLTHPRRKHRAASFALRRKSLDPSTLLARKINGGIFVFIALVMAFVLWKKAGG